MRAACLDVWLGGAHAQVPDHLVLRRLSKMTPEERAADARVRAEAAQRDTLHAESSDRHLRGIAETYASGAIVSTRARYGKSRRGRVKRVGGGGGGGGRALSSAPAPPSSDAPPSVQPPPEAAASAPAGDASGEDSGGEAGGAAEGGDAAEQ